MTSIPKTNDPNRKMLHTLAPGEQFIHNGEKYTRIADERLCCCKVNNCIKLSDNSKTMIVPATNVEVV